MLFSASHQAQLEQETINHMHVIQATYHVCKWTAILSENIERDANEV
jgi:hypothetical protein